MNDLYLIENSAVLKNLLGITNEKELDLAEAELSRANMMLLYENGFDDFSSGGFCFIHKFLFGDVYEWAGQYRKINIKKREELLAGQSVWYSDCVNIENDLNNAWDNINKIKWDKLDREDFAKQIARLFPALWQVHPFREGNTRTTVMMMTFFIEYYGYYFDQILMAESAGYVRDSFVLASLGEYSEYEHLEKILLDAICTEPIDYDDVTDVDTSKNKKYEEYKSDYIPTKHEYIE
ncbi:MAG: Fic family protein [Acetobacter sp.]|nr:Fic family protein [Bacteroides sp.]MCM1341608.1 Fic family protein [Acetobacter sp.]MCM1434071.1 Fic family protein [Clostridiales bacterium]